MRVESSTLKQPVFTSEIWRTEIRHLIIVLSEGKAIEIGTPRELLEAKGYFWNMVMHSGDKTTLQQTILGSSKDE